MKGIEPSPPAWQAGVLTIELHAHIVLTDAHNVLTDAHNVLTDAHNVLTDAHKPYLTMLSSPYRS